MKEIYDFILAEEANFRANRVPITGSKDWNMHEHIERCTNVANGWYHKGKNDGMRPYKDIVTPIKNVALRLEGFDVKDIVPFVDDVEQSYKSFLVKKYHPKWAIKYGIDEFIDQLVESSVIYDLALVKNVNNERPEVIPLQSIAFCDQTNVMAYPICLKHQFTVAEFLDFKGKWYDDKIEEAIVMARASKKVSQANDVEAKTPGKYMEVYELHGYFPERWLGENDSENYIPQLHIVTYYQNEQGQKNGITLFKGREKKQVFDALVINKVFGRACGVSIIESLFEPQVWVNYDEIRIKALLDATAMILLQTASDETASQKLDDIKSPVILKHEEGKPITRIDTSVQNIIPFQNHQVGRENDARTIGSASDASLGENPTAGTPFALQNLIVQEGQGMHEFRQGKIATFVGDRIYKNWVLKYLVNEMNNGKKFSDELSLDELQEVAEAVTNNVIEKRIKDQILSGGDVPTAEERDQMKQVYKEEFFKKGNRRFFEALKKELDSIPVDVFVNIKGKQKNMARNADAITNIIREVIRNPQAFQQVPGVGKAFNQLIEESGMSPIDFSAMITDTSKLQPNPATMQQPGVPTASVEDAKLKGK